MTEEQTYAVAIADYDVAVFNLMRPPADADNSALQASFRRLRDYLKNNETIPTAAIPGPLLPLLRADATPAELAQLVQLREAADTAATAIPGNEQSVKDGVRDAIRRQMELRILNDTTHASGEGDIGRYNAEDINGALREGERLRRSRTQTITVEDAANILRRWLEAHLPEDAETESLKETLHETDLSRVQVTLPSGEINPDVLHAFQRSQGITDDKPLTDPVTIRALYSDNLYLYNAGRRGAREAGATFHRFTTAASDWITGLTTERPQGGAPRVETATAPTGTGIVDQVASGAGDMWQNIQDFFGNIIGDTSAGGWLGGALGAAGAWFASSMFGAGPFRGILMVLLMPLMFILGRNMGNEWGQNGDGDTRGDGVQQGSGDRQSALAAGQATVVTAANDGLIDPEALRLATQHFRERFASEHVNEAAGPTPVDVVPVTTAVTASLRP